MSGTTRPPRTDTFLLQLIAERDQLHSDSPPMGPNEADTKRIQALTEQIDATIPVTLNGALAMLEFAEDDDDPLITSVVAGLRGIIARPNESPYRLPSRPSTTPIEKLIAVEERVRSMSVRISDAADDFKFWLEKQDQSVHELAADRDYNAAALYKAIAARAFHRFINFRSTAEYHGAELPEYGIAPTEGEAGERYERLVEEWIWEPVTTAAHAMALVQFANCIAADKLMARVGGEGGPVSEETDALHQLIALSAAASWMMPHANREGMTRLRQEEAERPGSTTRLKPD